ncbi:hypothetical protein C8J57DRAFT_1545868 [Mycena rebaudengoi]|nr:hypothetical protein C8J57DRAFT_1545868 [Mycena rebaudengoi]
MRRILDLSGVALIGRSIVCFGLSVGYVVHGWWKQGYEIFMDEWFTLHAIDAGYEHESVVKNIHELLINFHRTFVLVKRDRSEHASVKEQISAQGKELEAQLKVLARHLLDLRAREEELSLIDEAMN